LSRRAGGWGVCNGDFTTGRLVWSWRLARRWGGAGIGWVEDNASWGRRFGSIFDTFLVHGNLAGRDYAVEITVTVGVADVRPTERSKCWSDIDASVLVDVSAIDGGPTETLSLGLESYRR
jgi:hypothetical protein